MFYSAFILGFAGSLHCFGMCGPLSLLLPSKKSIPLKYIYGRFVYNFGRIFTYMVLGLIIGTVGEQIGMVVPQKIIFLVLGSLLLLYVLVPKRLSNKLSLVPQVSKLNSFVKMFISKAATKNGTGVHFAFGLVNGLIPCGLVYAALSGAFLAANAVDSMLYMAYFGLGTLPMMMSFGFIGSFLFKYLKLKPTTIYTFSFLVLGLFMVYKGIKTPINHYVGNDEITICNGK